MSKVMFSIFVVAVLALVSVAPAESYVWDGGGDDVSWDDPENWDPTGVPNGSDDSAVVLDPSPSYDDQYLSPVVDLEDVTVEYFCGPACGQSDVNQVMTVDGVTFTITSAETEDNWKRDGDFGDDPERSYWEIRLINGARWELPNGGARLFDHGKGRFSLADDSSLYVNGELRAADDDDGYMWIVTTGTSDINIAQDLFFGDDGGGCFDFGGNSTITVGKNFFIPGREEEVLGRKNLMNIRDNAVVNAAGIGVHASKGGAVEMNVYGGTVNAGFLRVACEVCKGEEPEGTGEIYVHGGTVNISGDITIPDYTDNDAEGLLEQTGGTINCCTLVVKDKGTVELLGGTLEITCAGSLDCDGGVINIAGGSLILPGDACAEVADLEAAGCLSAYYVVAGACAGSTGELICNYDSMSDKTTVTALQGDTSKAWSPDPADGAVEQSVDVVLCWCAGDSIGKKGHAVYFGTSYDDVNDPVGIPPIPIFRGYLPPLSPQCYDPPEELELWTPYFWRIDEFNADLSVTKGDVWSFTTGCEKLPGDINLDCFVNFEDYAMMADDWTVEVWFPDDL